MVLKGVKPYKFLVKGLMIGLLLFPLHLFSQKLKINEYDKLKKKWRMETFPINIKSANNTKMDVQLNAADTSYFLYVAGSGVGTNTIDEDSKLFFVFDNDSTVVVKSSSVQSIDYGNIIPSYKHGYLLSFENLEMLSRNNVKTLRKYSIGGFDDVAVEKEKAQGIKELTSFFIAELKKGKLIPVKPIVLPPGFPGGDDVLVNFLNRNLKLPSDTDVAEEKKAIIQFIVTADGSIRDLQIKNSTGTMLDDELLRILKRMPKWKPALQNGKQVEFTVTQPVKFYRSGALLKLQLG